MARYNFTSTGAAFGGGIEEFLMERALMDRQRILDELKRKEDEADRAARDREFRFREGQEARVSAEQRRQAERQTALDAEADRDRRTTRSREQNQIGVRQMIQDRLTQGPLDADTARQVAAMGWGAGVGVPGIIDTAMQPPRRTVVQTMDDRGNPVRRAVTDEELETGVREYVAPERTPAPVRTEVELPAPVQDYLQSLRIKVDPATGQRYTQQRAEDEITRQWPRLRDAHPQLNMVRVKQAIETLFRRPDDLDALFAGEEPAPAGGAGQPAGGGRTATMADVRAVAQRAGISAEEARRGLEAAGVVIR